MFAHLALVAGRGHLAAAGAGRLVPARRGVAGLTAMTTLHRRCAIARRPGRRGASAVAACDGRPTKAGSRRSSLLQAGNARCSGSGASQAVRAHGAHRCRARRARGPQPRVRGAIAIPSVGRLHRARHPPGARDARPVGAGARGPRRRARLAATTASGPCGIRSDRWRELRRKAAPSPMRFCRPKARACTRFRSARFTPASSNPATSASPRTARPIVRLEERLGYVHKGIESLMAGAADRACRGARRARFRRQHRRLRAGLCPGDRGGARHRGSARARSGCARSWPSWSGSPITSATSAPSATMPRSP